MSRGPGKTMRALDRMLTFEPQLVHDLAARIYDVPTASTSQVETVRQAAHALKHRGRARLEFHRHHRGRRAVRLPLTESELAQIDAARAAYGLTPLPKAATVDGSGP